MWARITEGNISQGHKVTTRSKNLADNRDPTWMLPAGTHAHWGACSMHARSMRVTHTHAAMRIQPHAQIDAFGRRPTPAGRGKFQGEWRIPLPQGHLGVQACKAQRSRPMKVSITGPSPRTVQEGSRKPIQGSWKKDSKAFRPNPKI